MCFLLLNFEARLCGANKLVEMKVGVYFKWIAIALSQSLETTSGRQPVAGRPSSNKFKKREMKWNACLKWRLVVPKAHSSLYLHAAQLALPSPSPSPCLLEAVTSSTTKTHNLPS